jgi:hypothetical protein
MITEAEALGMFKDGKVFKKIFYPGDGWGEHDGSETFPRVLIPDGIEVMPERILPRQRGDMYAEMQKLFGNQNLPVSSLSGQAAEKQILAALKRILDIGYTHLYAIIFRQIDVEVGDPLETFSSTSTIAVGLRVKKE